MASAAPRAGEADKLFLTLGGSGSLAVRAWNHSSGSAVLGLDGSSGARGLLSYTTASTESQETRRGPRKSMGNKVPWKTGVLIYLPVTLRPTHFPAERSSFITLQLRDHPFDSLHSEFLSPLNFATHETEDPFATPHKDFVLASIPVTKESSDASGSAFGFLEVPVCASGSIHGPC